MHCSPYYEQRLPQLSCIYLRPSVYLLLRPHWPPLRTYSRIRSVFSIGFPIGDALTWMPVLFWAVETGNPIVLSAATALELLSGQPQTSVAVFMFLAGFALWRLRSRRKIVRAGFAVLVGFVIATPQVVPCPVISSKRRRRATVGVSAALLFGAHTFRILYACFLRNLLTRASLGIQCRRLFRPHCLLARRLLNSRQTA